MAGRPDVESTPTVYDVAQHANVSIATVSRYFSAPHKLASHTRDRVASAISELGYVQNSAARRLAGGRTGTVALCLPDFGDDEPDIDLTVSDGRVRTLNQPTDSAENGDLYYSEILLGAEMECRRNDLALTVLIDRDEALEERLSRLGRQVDGMVVVAPALSDAKVAELGRKMPIVLLAARERDPGVDTARCDNAAGMAALTSHLLDAHGVREAVFIAGPEQSPDSASRFQGFCRSLAEHGLPAPDGPLWRGDFTRAGGADAARRILAAGPVPEALVCANDQTALGVLTVLSELGLRPPNDVLVTGFDDISAARWTSPPLTTVRQPMLMLGRAAVSLLLHRDDTLGTRPANLTLPVDLVIRHSCGCR